ncbi:BlaI/MecI/CopY family transcriptional regulator [Streptomyces sp. NRRL S-244]|uniref:BlaI/MecI/CopY family transcriptional regulator n=1 Tax=Streptomyces sp. NRRL S-244 TaxID=1463897 RepID=UPI0004C0645F|nr:BlaI/MecI/CopY family transcriptional regulator [Streptomyces sp. NRRL S-244]
MVEDGADARRPHGELVADVLAALWAADGPLTPQQINTALGRDLARTTVTTILTRLYEKGTVVRTRVGRGFVYAAADDAAGLAAGRMHRELDREPRRDLVLKRFVSSLSGDDEEALRRLLLESEEG